MLFCTRDQWFQKFPGFLFLCSYRIACARLELRTIDLSMEDGLDATPPVNWRKCIESGGAKCGLAYRLASTTSQAFCYPSSHPPPFSAINLNGPNTPSITAAATIMTSLKMWRCTFASADAAHHYGRRHRVRGLRGAWAGIPVVLIDIYPALLQILFSLQYLC